MASTQDPSEPSEKPEESAQETDAQSVEDADESSPEEADVIDAEVVETPMEPEDETGNSEPEKDSDEPAETFPPSEEADEASSPFIPMVLGGLAAGGIGFLAAYALLPKGADNTAALAGITASTEETAAGLAALDARVAEIGASIPEAADTSGLESAVTALEDKTASLTDGLSAVQAIPEVDLTGITSELAALGERVTALELDEGNASSAQAAEARAQLEEFRGQLEALIAEADAKVAAADARAAEIEAAAEAAARETEAAAMAAAKKAEERAALAKLRASVDGGAGFSDLIEGMENVPPELTSHASTGVPTLIVLQQEFPDAARAALATVQTVPDDASTGQRLTAFLRRQTNARSLAPKEGDDPDAVLSRAEARLGEGRLNDALSELSALPDDAQSAMSGWLTDARTREAALQAVDALAAKTN